MLTGPIIGQDFVFSNHTNFGWMIIRNKNQTWDVSLITEKYFDKTTVNDDISDWNVSNVTNIQFMVMDVIVLISL